MEKSPPPVAPRRRSAVGAGLSPRRWSLLAALALGAAAPPPHESGLWVEVSADVQCPSEAVLVAALEDQPALSGRVFQGGPPEGQPGLLLTRAPRGQLALWLWRATEDRRLNRQLETSADCGAMAEAIAAIVEAWEWRPGAPLTPNPASAPPSALRPVAQPRPASTPTPTVEVARPAALLGAPAAGATPDSARPSLWLCVRAGATASLGLDGSAGGWGSALALEAGWDWLGLGVAGGGETALSASDPLRPSGRLSLKRLELLGYASVGLWRRPRVTLLAGAQLHFLTARPQGFPQNDPQSVTLVEPWAALLLQLPLAKGWGGFAQVAFGATPGPHGFYAQDTAALTPLIQLPSVEVSGALGVQWELGR